MKIKCILLIIVQLAFERISKIAVTLTSFCRCLAKEVLGAWHSFQ
jgi:hypothetical protein